MATDAARTHDLTALAAMELLDIGWAMPAIAHVLGIDEAALQARIDDVVADDAAAHATH